MSEQITRTVSRALAGNRKASPTWNVVGVNARGEAFVAGEAFPYRDRARAADFAAEIRAAGGTANVVRVR